MIMVVLIGKRAAEGGVPSPGHKGKALGNGPGVQEDMHGQ